MGVDLFLHARSSVFWQFLDSVARAEEGLHGIADWREFVFQTPLRLEFVGADVISRAPRDREAWILARISSLIS